MSGVMNRIPTLTNTIDKLKGAIFNKKFILIIFIVVIFLGVAFYIYNTHVAPKLNPDFVPNREFTQGDNIKDAYIFLFYVDWCPYSKKAKPIWEQIKAKFNNKEINNVMLHFNEVDGEKEEKALENFEKEYLSPNDKKIDGYPSIWLVKGDQVIEFDAKPDINSLTEFINAVL